MMNSTSKKLILIAVLVLLGSMGLAMTIQLEDVFENIVQPNDELALASDADNDERIVIARPTPVLDSTDTIFVPPKEVFPLWETEVRGIDSTFDGDTVEFSVRVIGQDSALYTDMYVDWDTTRSAITLVSGDSSKRHNFIEDDTLTLDYTFVIGDTGSFNIWLVPFNDSVATIRKKMIIQNLYLKAYGDTTASVDSVVVTADTFPDNFIVYDTVPPDSGEALMMPVSKVTLTGKVYYYHKTTDEWGKPPEKKYCRGILVKASWFMGSDEDYTDEYGNYSLQVPENWVFDLFIEAENDAAKIGYGDVFFHQYEDLGSWTLQHYTSKDLDVRPADREKAWILNTAHDARRFCNSNFNWVPSSRVKIKYPKGDWPCYNCVPNVIRIPSGWVWGKDNRQTVAHEFGHFVDDNEYAIGFDRGPYGHDSKWEMAHYQNDRAGEKFAYTEGWAEFFEGAVAYDYYNLKEEDYYYQELDLFYSNGGKPYWRDDGGHSGLPDDSTWTYGNHVEGAIAQFLWDIFDEAENNESYHGGYDDDNIYNKVDDMWDAYDDNPQKIVDFKDEWDDNNSPYITEMYDVIIHNTSSTDRTVVPAPSNFDADYDYSESAVWIELTWTDNALNEGHFKIYRRDYFKNFTNWDESYLYDYEGENENSYTDPDVSSGVTYVYGIRAVDNDTSTIVLDTITLPFIWPGIADKISASGKTCSPPYIPGETAEVPWEIVADLETPSSVDIDYSTDDGASYSSIATGLEPGTPDQLLYTDVDENGDTIKCYGWKGSYEDWTVPNTPTTGLKFRYCVHLESGDSAIGYSKLNYAIPNGIGTVYSTAYTGYKQSDGSNKTCMVYTDNSDNVKYTESDDGTEWDTTITVSSAGKMPSATTVNDTPVVVWKDTSTNNQGLYMAAGPNWNQATVVSQLGAGQGYQHISEPNCFPITDTVCLAFFKDYGQTEASLDKVQLIGKRVTIAGSGLLDTLFQDLITPQSVNKAPALAVDQEDNTYYAFVYDGNTVFIFDDGATEETDTITTSSVAWPSLDVTEGNVYLTYGTVASGDTLLLRKWRYSNDSIWRGIDTLYDGGFNHLATTAGVYTVFTEPDNDMKLLTFDPIDGGSETQDLADSIVTPHINLSRLSDAQLAFEWTEQVGSNYYIMGERSDADANLPHLYLEGGTTITPFTEHRDSTHDYGDIEVDVGTDSLVYEIDDLDTAFDYSLKLEFYFESDSVDTASFILTASGETDTVDVCESALTRYTIIVDSLGSTLTTKITGSDIGLKRLILYESDETTPGYFSLAAEEDSDKPGLPIQFSLENIVPTPFTNTARIHFAMPVAQPVTIKVYDVSGRAVKTLINGTVEAGVHSIQWNGKDDQLRRAASGVYFVRMVTDGYEASRKTVLLR